MTAPDIDLLDLDRWAADGAPHAALAALRRSSPVWRHPSPTPDGSPGFWVVTGHAEVTALGRCPHALSSDGATGGVAGLGPGDELQAVQDRIGLSGGRLPLSGDTAMLLTLDPPEHTTYRKIVNRGFSPRMVTRLEDRVRALAQALLDPHCDGQAFDFTVDVAMPVPMTVIAEMIGAPPAMHADLLRWSNQAVAGTDPEYHDAAFEHSELAAAMQLFQAFNEIRSRHEAEPADDLTTVLLDAVVDGESLSPARFLMFLFLLALAGNETTRNAVSHGVMAFAEHPEEWKRLRDDPSLIPSAVEEILRFASPVLYFRRNAVAEVEVAGATIAPGDVVSLWYVAANRDESIFDDPDRFDVGRGPNPHVAFGGGGPHFCLGASLARLELRVLLEEMVERYDRIDLAGPVSRLRSNFLHGIKHLPVVLHPSG